MEGAAQAAQFLQDPDITRRRNGFHRFGGKPVIVTCALATMSFMIILVQTILNWVETISTDDRIWDRAKDLMELYLQRNQSEQICPDSRR